MGAYHALYRGTTDGIHWCCRELSTVTALRPHSRARRQKRIYLRVVVSLERRVKRVQVDVRWTMDGGTSERSDNRGGRHQGIVVEIPCQKQSASSAVHTIEGTSISRL